LELLFSQVFFRWTTRLIGLGEMKADYAPIQATRSVIALALCIICLLAARRSVVPAADLFALFRLPNRLLFRVLVFVGAVLVGGMLSAAWLDLGRLGEAEAFRGSRLPIWLASAGQDTDTIRRAYHWIMLSDGILVPLWQEIAFRGALLTALLRFVRPGWAAMFLTGLRLCSRMMSAASWCMEGCPSPCVRLSRT
jgi:hypothetical protein